MSGLAEAVESGLREYFGPGEYFDAVCATATQSVVDALKAAGFAPDRVRSREQLDALPTMAVIEDRENRVFQKWPHRVLGRAWYLPGMDRGFPSSEVALPARLLDDGL